MPEIILKYKSAKVLKTIEEFDKVFDVIIENPADKNELNQPDDYSALPIVFSKNPDVTA